MFYAIKIFVVVFPDGQGLITYLQVDIIPWLYNSQAKYIQYKTKPSIVGQFPSSFWVLFFLFFLFVFPFLVYVFVFIILFPLTFL